MRDAFPSTSRDALGHEFVALCETLDGLARLPRVRALHLPRVVDGGKHAAFCALELEGGILGMAYVSLGDTRARLAASPEVAALAGTDPVGLVRAGAGADSVRRALGLAAINALTRWLFDRVGFMPAASADAVGGISVAPHARIGMVGLFSPLAADLAAAGADLIVIERDPALAGVYPGYCVTLDTAALSGREQVLCTSTVLLNGTLDEVLSHCADAGVIALVGPSAGCFPDPLFARGITLIGGSWIDDARGVVDALASGTRWTPYAHKFALERADYPGVRALLCCLR